MEARPVWGAVGSGRGNIRNGDSFTAFDFAALCSGELNNTVSNSAYKAKWKEEPTKLSVLVHYAGSDKNGECEFRTDVHPKIVYVRYSDAGTINTLTQDEFKVRRENRMITQASAVQTETPAKTTASPSGKSKLRNDDVIAMARDGLSTDIITAKIDVSECSFDTSPDGISKLKAAKIPDKVIIQMIKKAG